MEEFILPSPLALSLNPSACPFSKFESLFSTNYPHYTKHGRSGEAVEVQEELNGEVRAVLEKFALH